MSCLVPTRQDDCKNRALCWESITSHTDRELTETQEEPWTLFTDGSSCVNGLGAGLILTNPDGVEFTYVLRFQFAASNNEAEYEALIAGLRIATQMGVKNIQANVDSKLVASQVLGAYLAKEDNMIKYLEIVKALVSGFKTFSISQVPRSRNKKVDALSKIASTSFTHLSKQVLVEVLETKSITGKEVTAVIEEEGPTWMTELVNYLKEGVAVAEDPESENVSSPTEVGSPGSVYRPEWGVTNGSLLDTSEACQDLVDHAAPLEAGIKRAVEEKSAGLSQELERMHFDEELYPHMLTAIAGHRWVIGHGLRLAMMKCAESLEMRQRLSMWCSRGLLKA
nr:reverse transcriptase domain-containing protein [Tanacetum cinerariifolium]